MKPADDTVLFRIGLASAWDAPTVEKRLQIVDRFVEDAARRNVAIVCFPEAYIPGLRGMDFPVSPPDQARQEDALRHICESARRNRVAVIMGMEWEVESCIHNVAFVISRYGTVDGFQAKNQIPPSEEPHYRPDGRCRLFEVDGIPFGITICHEGWRYPEASRWLARHGAKIIFHPHITGSDELGVTPAFWGDPSAPYYEKAMIARAVENSVWFASVNHVVRCQESATSLIDPDGVCVAHVPYGEEQLLVFDLDPARATGFYARRLDPTLY